MTSNRAKKKFSNASVITTQTRLRQDVRFTLRKQETYSPMARNIFGILQAKLSTNGTNLFYLYKEDIEHISGETTNSNDIMLGLNQLRDFSIWIDDIKLSSNLLSSWQQITGRLFEVEISDKLMKYFINVTTSFTEYTLENLVTLKKKYSKRIYEILASFSNKPSCNFGLEKFKEYLFIKNLETDKDKYPAWYDFNRYVIDPAILEINEKTELDITYKPKKKGRSVIGIIFYFKAEAHITTQTQFSLNFDLNDNNDLDITVLKEKYQLRHDQALIFLRNYNLIAEQEKMHKIWERSLPCNNHLPDFVKNIGGYIVHIYNLYEKITPSIEVTN